MIRVTVSPTRFARELARRGITSADIRIRGKFDSETVAAIRAGRPVRESTLRKLDATLANFPVLPIVESLLEDEPAPLAQID